MSQARSNGPVRRGRFMRWPVLFSAVVVVFGLISVSTVRETYQEWKVDQEIQGLQSQVQLLEGKHTTLLDTIQRLQSEDALDREARTHLGMRKPGERVIMVRGLSESAGYSWKESWPTAASTTASTGQVDSGTNPRRWFRYFFHFTLPTS